MLYLLIFLCAYEPTPRKFIIWRKCAVGSACQIQSGFNIDQVMFSDCVACLAVLFYQEECSAEYEDEKCCGKGSIRDTKCRSLHGFILRTDGQWRLQRIGQRRSE